MFDEELADWDVEDTADVTKAKLDEDRKLYGSLLEIIERMIRASPNAERRLRFFHVLLELAAEDDSSLQGGATIVLFPDPDGDRLSHELILQMLRRRHAEDGWTIGQVRNMTAWLRNLISRSGIKGFGDDDGKGGEA